MSGIHRSLLDVGKGQAGNKCGWLWIHAMSSVESTDGKVGHRTLPDEGGVDGTKDGDRTSPDKVGIEAKVCKMALIVVL